MKGKIRSFRFYEIINVTFCFFIFYFGNFLMNNCINIIIPYVETAYGWSRGEVNSVVTVGSLLSVVAGIVIISAIMKVGLKKVWGIIVLVTGVFSIVLGLAENFALFSLSLVVFQMSSTTAFMVLPGFLLANWFVKRRGRVLGIATMGGFVSGTTCNLLVSAIIEHHSFALAFGLLGVAILVLGVTCFLFVVERPEEVGLTPDGVPMDRNDNALRDECPVESVKAMTTKQLFRIPETWLYIVVFGLLAMIRTGVGSQLIPHLMDGGYDMTTATNLFALNALVGIPMVLVWGWFTDKVSLRIASAILAAGFAVSCMLVVFADVNNLPLTVVAMGAVGGLQCGLSNIETAIIAYVFGRIHFASANRVLRAGASVLRSLGYAAMGLAYTYTQSYNISYTVFAILSVVTIGLVLMMKGCYDSESPRYNRTV